MMRFQVPPRADSLNHTPIRYVNNLLLKLIDGKTPWLIRCANVMRELLRPPLYYVLSAQYFG